MRFEKRGNQRAERFDAVRSGSEDDHGDRKGAKILLMLQVLIGGQQRIEGGSAGQLEELAVALAGPAKLGDGQKIVLGEQTREGPRK